MNTQKLNKLTAIAAFGFAFFILLWTVISFSILPFEKGQSDYSLMVTDPQWTIVAIMGLLSVIFGIFTLFGIYHDCYENGGVLLFIGIVIFVLGILLEFAGLTWDLFVWPVICASDEYISFVREGIFIKSQQFNIFIIMMLGFLLAGTVITALALMRSKKYGKWVPWLLIVGVILYGIGNLVYIYLATAGLIIYCLAFVLIGFRLLNARDKWMGR